MHKSNRVFWEECSKQNPRYFNDPSMVIELGSLFINGSIRDYFNCQFYVGVDWRKGVNVDLVSLAHEVGFSDGFFDTVISASMLEHDPYWEKSIVNMIRMMRHDGILILTWGAALNQAHCPEAAPDGIFHALPAARVLDLMEKQNMYVHQFQYEWSLLPANKDVMIKQETLYHPVTGLRDLGTGEVALVAFKDQRLAAGNQVIDNLLDLDKTWE